MTDYISRETAIENAIAQMRVSKNEKCMRERLLNLEPADVQPVVRGKWIPDYDYAEYDYDGSTPLTEPRKFQDGWQCSLCGGYMPGETNFCPNCGADMREEQT